MKPIRVRPHVRRIPAMPGINIQEGKIDYLRRDPTPPNEDARQAARAYMRSIGRELPPPHPRVKPDPEVLRRIALAYRDLESRPDDPEVRAAYNSLADETFAQWEFMKSFVRVEFVDFDPYQGPTGGPSSTLMFQDIRDNQHMFVYTGGDPHPIMSQIIHPETGETANNVFRAVHDAFGHNREGNSFSESGEFNAYLDHKVMYSQAAGRALAVETLAQNAFWNRSPANEGKPASERIFAPQRAALLPDELVV